MTTSQERLEKILIKVERAKKHSLDLEGELRSFFDGRPYQVGVKRDPDTRKLIYFMSQVQEVPPMFAVITGEIIYNLRSALDHLAYRLVEIGTGGRGPYGHVYFPIAETAAAYPHQRNQKTKGMRPDAIGAIDALQPYKGGNDTLWRLHRMNNIDKHRLLLTVGSAFQSLNLGSYFQRQMKASGFFENEENIPFFDLNLRPADRLFPLKVEDELYIAEPDSEPDEKLKFNFEVSFGETNILEGEPLLEPIKQMIKTVEEIILSFEPYLA